MCVDAVMSRGIKFQARRDVWDGVVAEGGPAATTYSVFMGLF